jgi:hypothetical protein
MQPQQVGELLCMDDEWIVPPTPIEDTDEEVVKETGLGPGEASRRKVDSHLSPLIAPRESERSS